MKYKRELLFWSPLLIVPVAVFSWLIVFHPGNLVSVDGLTGLKDNVGWVRFAQMAQTMSWPFGIEKWTNAPLGERAWNVSSLTQSIQMSVIWALAKVFDAFVAANIFTAFGWMLTGIAVTCLSRVVGILRIPSLALGIGAQLVPGLLLASTTVPAMTFSGTPLFVAALLFRWWQTEGRKFLFGAFVVVLLSVLFDGYIYYFSMMVLLVGLVANARLVFRALKVSPVIISVSLAICFSVPIIATAFRVLGIDQAPAVRKLSPPSIWLMKLNGAEPLTLLAGIGPVLALLALVGILASVIVRNREWIAISAIVIVLSLLAMKSSWDTPFGALPNPLSLALPLFPGALYLDRAAFVATNFALVLSGVGATWITSRFLSVRQVRGVLAGSILVAGFAVLSPLSTLTIYDDSKIYEPIRVAVGHRQVLFLPYSFHDRDWIQQVYVDAPMVNSLQNPTMVNEIDKVLLPDTPKQNMCKLQELGVATVIVENQSTSEAEFNSSRFQEPYFFESSRISLQAYEIKATELVSYELSNTKC